MSSADRSKVIRTDAVVRRSAAVASNTTRFTLKPLARALSGFAGLVPVIAWAQLPTGGQVVAGSATINQPDGNHLVIQQNSGKAIVNWQQFSIGQDGYVQFIQPGKSAIALNRVVGADPSSILGQLSANGQVFLINPNGVVFGAGAKVNVAGLVATTMNISDEDFQKGDYRFKHDAANAGGVVINAGSIDVAKGGYVVLAGDYVENQGVIQARAGTALLASGNALTLQLSGSQLVDFAVDEASVVQLAGVKNTGQILAAGGRVIMTAKVASDLAATVVNNEGLVQAQSTEEHDGVIYLVGEGGNVANAGTLDASAQAGANGGHVEIRASGDIQHKAGSRISVSGADTGSSNAGSVYTWADGTNRFAQGARIEGKGGAEGGNGATVELSGKAVQIAGDVDLHAPKGSGGSILLDPLNITITNQGNTAVGGSTVGELWIENQLNAGTNVSILADGGAGASITLEDLTDGVLDGTNGGGTGGSLTLTASGAGSSIVFANTANTIKVDRNLTLKADDGAGGYAGTSINVGKLVAGQGTPNGGGLNNNTVWTAGLTVDAGSVTATGLTLGKSISTNTDATYTLNARAHNGDLTVNGDVKVDVANSVLGSVKTNTTLRSDTGDVKVTGAVSSTARGQGYAHYIWQTAGNPATTYLGAQPWTQTGSGDHQINSSLTINAGGKVDVGGQTDVLAIDSGNNFQAADTKGGYWSTPGATQRIFWRATTSTATANINAGTSASFGGAVNVRADGYVTQSYSETEFYDRMVAQYNLISQNQQIYQTYGDHDSNPATPNQWYNPQSVTVTTTAQGSATGNYTWRQSGQNANGSGPYSSAQTTGWSNSLDGSATTAMGYSGVAGPSATLTLNAGGNVTLNGMDVRATNRTTDGSSSFTDSNWGHQNTAGGSQTAYNNNSVSSQVETWWHDTFNTSYSAATANAGATITAGDNSTATLNGGAGVAYNVVGEHPNITPSGNSRAAASMTLTAGTASGATGGGLITIDAPVNVIGASSSEVNLTVRNYDGAIVQGAGLGDLTVTNGYTSGDAKASLRSDTSSVTVNSVAVSAGRAANATLWANTALQTGSVSAAAWNSTGTATLALNGGTDVTVLGDLIATAEGYQAPETNRTQIGGLWHYYYTVDGGNASINVQSTSGNVDLRGDVKATAYETAAITATANGVGRTLTTAAGKTVTAKTTGQQYTESTYQHYTLPTYSAGVTLSADAGMTLDSSAQAILNNRNGNANVAITTLGGTGATIHQGATSAILADGYNGAVTVNAGDAAPAALNAAALDMLGSVKARGGSGTAAVTVKGSGGSVGGAGAESTGSTAQVTLAALASNGTLTLTGSGGATANSNTGTGAQFLVTAAGGIDAGDSQLVVRNNNTLAASGAEAKFTSTAGAVEIGDAAVSTAGGSAALLKVDAYGDAIASGIASATANIGTATAQLLSSHGQAKVGSGGSFSSTTTSSVATTTIDGATGVVVDGNVSAQAGASQALVTLNSGDTLNVGSAALVKAVTTNGTATVNVTSVNAMQIDGDLLAQSPLSTAAINLATTGGGAATIGQGSGSEIKATGTTANVTVKAGSSGTVNAGNAAALDLLGALIAQGGSNSTLSVYGAGGIVHDFNVSSTGGNAKALVQSYDANSTLTLDGNGLVIGNVNNATAVDLTVNAAGDLDTSTATLGVTNNNTASLANASLTLTSSGNAQLGDATATSQGGAASINASSGATTVYGALAVNANGTNGSNATLNVTSVTDALTLDLASALNVTSASGNATATLLGQTGLAADGAITAIATNGDASVGLTTAGGSDASITQGAQSVISATGRSAAVTVNAGDASVDASNAAGLGLAGSLNVHATQTTAALLINGSGGNVHDFSVLSDNSNASAQIKSFSANGNLVLDGAGDVQGNANGATGSLLSVAAAGALDTSAAQLTSTNTNLGNAAGAKAELSAANGLARLGSIDVDSSGGGLALITGSGSTGVIADGLSATGYTSKVSLTAANGGSAELGNVTVSSPYGSNIDVQAANIIQQAGKSIGATSVYDTAQIDLTASDSLWLRDISTHGATGVVNATAQNGTLIQIAGTTTQVNADNAATATFTSHDEMNIAGNVQSNATLGAANVILNGAGLIKQGAGSTIGAAGAAATTRLNAGTLNSAGLMKATATNGAAALNVNVANGAGTLKNFDVSSTAGRASANIVGSGALTFNGAGNVTGNQNGIDGAALNVTSGGVLDTTAATLAIANNHNGAQAGAKATLNSGSSFNAGSIAISAKGGKDAAMALHAVGTLTVAGNLFADAYNTGAGLGGATIALSSGSKSGGASSVVQNSGSTIRARSAGTEAGNAQIDIAANSCCDSSVKLLGTTLAEVGSGAGNAGIQVHGAKIEVPALTARVNGSGRGNSLIDLAAPTQITVNGVLTSQAASQSATAGIKLVTDTLNYFGANPVLSQGNGRVQLAPFNTTWLIGVDSKNDFDSRPAIDYNKALLQKFVGLGNNAQIEFGGAYDRSAWINAGTPIVSGMSQWQNLGQQTGDIHVAGATGALKLVATTMVFDTTGGTYYHDNSMSPWSVPNGRTAIFVPYPTPSLDRYLDRTENSLQQPITGLESAAAANHQYGVGGAVAPEGTVAIAGNMFMAGDGVNMTQVASTGGPANPLSEQGRGAVDGGKSPSSQKSGSSGFTADDDRDDEAK